MILKSMVSWVLACHASKDSHSIEEPSATLINVNHLSSTELNKKLQNSLDPDQDEQNIESKSIKNSQSRRVGCNLLSVQTIM